MKETKLYTCEYCGKQSANEQEIKDCEAKHIKEKKLSEEKKKSQDAIELALAQYKEKYGEDYLPKFFKTRNGLFMVEKYASGCIDKPSQKEKSNNNTNTWLNDKSNGYTHTNLSNTNKTAYYINGNKVDKETYEKYLKDNCEEEKFKEFCDFFDEDIFNYQLGTTYNKLKNIR